MIKNPAIRTRALYAWEQQDLSLRHGVYQIRSLVQMRNYLNHMWAAFTKGRRAKPSLEYWKKDIQPFSEGYARIVMTDGNRSNLMLVHEVTHALGFGSPVNPHSVGFVHAYIRHLALWFDWEPGELHMQAKFRKLL